jgi:transcriptional regulator with XRE-family HTH domain
MITVMEQAPRPATIGELLHDERVRAALTLEQLASEAELSAAHLSRIESGDRQPSIGALLALARALGVSVGTLLGEHPVGPAFSVHRPGGPTHQVNGLALSGVSGFPGSSMIEALRISISPERVAPEPAVHHGEEWIYVLSGLLRLECGGDVHLLEPGSSAHLDAQLPHRLGAEGVTTEVLVVTADSLKELYNHPQFTSNSLVH